jgi:hypothetical protein
MDVMRPNKIRALMRSAVPSADHLRRQDGHPLHAGAKYYSTVEFTGTIGGGRRAGGEPVEMPLSDLFLFGTPAAPLDKIESAMNAGQDFIDDDLCDHYAFRQGKIDWQIWITTGGKPLPRKVVITNRADEARPQSVSLIDWNLKPKFKDAVFKFTPPRARPRSRSFRGRPSEERHHDETNRKIRRGRGAALVLASFAMAPYAEAAGRGGGGGGGRGGGGGGAHAGVAVVGRRAPEVVEVGRSRRGGRTANAQVNNSRADSRTNDVRNTSVNNVNNVNVDATSTSMSMAVAATTTGTTTIRSGEAAAEHRRCRDICRHWLNGEHRARQLHAGQLRRGLPAMWWHVVCTTGIAVRRMAHRTDRDPAANPRSLVARIVPRQRGLADLGQRRPDFCLALVARISLNGKRGGQAGNNSSYPDDERGNDRYQC